MVFVKYDQICLYYTWNVFFFSKEFSGTKQPPEEALSRTFLFPQISTCSDRGVLQKKMCRCWGKVQFSALRLLSRTCVTLTKVGRWDLIFTLQGTNISHLGKRKTPERFCGENPTARQFKTDALEKLKSWKHDVMLLDEFVRLPQTPESLYIDSKIENTWMSENRELNLACLWRLSCCTPGFFNKEYQ